MAAPGSDAQWHPSWCGSPGALQAVTVPVDSGETQTNGGGQSQHFAHSADVHVDGSRRCDVTLSPHDLHDLATREHFAQVVKQQRGYLEFAARQLHCHAVALDPPLFQINAKRRQLNHFLAQ